MSILKYFKYALLATAAYVRMGDKSLDGVTFADEASSEDQDRLPPSVAERLFIFDEITNPIPWQILYYYGGDNPDVEDKTGLAATLFEADGEKVLAVRGVEPVPFSGDVFNDLFGATIGGIGIVGNAVTQLLDLVNLIQRLYADKGANVTQYEARVSLIPPQDPDASRIVLQAQIPQEFGRPDIPVLAYLTFDSYEEAGAGEGVLAAGEAITLTGHSLGGHLAVLAAELLPNLVNPDVYAFNSPGVDPITTDVVAAVSSVNPYSRYFVQGTLGIARTALARSLGFEAVFLSGGAGLSNDGVMDGLKALLGTPEVGLDALRVHNLESEDSARGDDFSLVTSIFSGLTSLGEEEYIPTEANSHSIEQMMDALALHAVFYRLDDTLTLPQIKQFVDYARDVTGESEESLVEALHSLFVPNSRFARNGLQLPTSAADGLDKWIDKGELSAREAHHVALLELNAWIDENPDKNISFASLIEENDTPITVAQVRETAKNGPNAYAYRYALKHGLPFAVIGADYAPHNKGALEFYDATNNTGDLTAAWLDEIAEFHYWKNRAFIADLPGVGDVGTPSRSYRQLASDIRFYTAAHPEPDPESVSPAGDPYAPPEPSNPPRTIFGSDLSDTLIGGVEADRLYGGAGADFLLGNEGDDYLEGGIGFDVYHYRAERDYFVSDPGSEPLFEYKNHGTDTILDTDARGALRYEFNDLFAQIDSVSVIGGLSIEILPGQWRSSDGRFAYSMEPTTDPLPTLRIDVLDEPGGTMFLEDWQDGELFIALQDARFDPVTSVSILGDLEPGDANPSTPEIELRFDSLGNVERTNVPEPGRDDVLLGDRPTAEAPPDVAGERIEAGAGNDTILADRPNGVADNGLGNADWISAGEGRDWVEAGAGNDLIEGGGGGVIGGEFGGEVIHAGPGDDQIYSGEKIAVSQAVDDGSSGSSLGRKGDFSYGGAGDDWLVGSQLDDILNGGEGRDLIVAGAGDDIVDGDVREWAETFAWSVTRKVVATADDFYDYFVNIDGAEHPEGQNPDDGSDDTIYAGAGNDVVYGRGGKDFINAGADDDFVFGGAGEDVVLGGAGDDQLAGDGPVAGDKDAADYLEGGAGDDILWGAGGDDFLVGGKGDDILDGGGGADVYLFNRGDGVDIFRDTADSSAGKDASVFVFGEGIKRDDIKFRPGSLIIDLGPSVVDDPASLHDTIYVEGFDANDPFSTPLISEMYFADGDAMSFEDIVAQGFEITGTEFNDNGEDQLYPSLVGTEIRDQVSGLAGDDVLLGLGGDDVLDGGAGADFMQGGAGDDLYLVDALDEVVDAEGSNSLQFVDGTIIGDVELVRTMDLGDEYLGLYVGRHGIIAIDAAQPAFSRFSFSDGATLSYEELLGARFFEAQNLSGGDEDDVLIGHAADDQLSGLGGNDALLGHDGDDWLDGGAGNDVLDGGGGNDELLGGSGADVYLLYTGSGNDQIIEDGESYDYDFIAVEEGISSSDVTLERLSKGNLSVTLSSGDSVEVKDYYNDPRAKIEALVFTDGTVIDSTVLGALEVLPIVGTPGNDTLTGTEWADTIEGLAGDDVLIGGDGDDVLLGGEGGDTLSGDAGNDSLDGGPGADVYVLEFGGGQDTAIDTDGVVRLGTSLTLGDVDAFQGNSDLRLSIRGTTDSLLVGGYFDAPQNWSIEGAQGEPGSIPDLLTATADLGARGFERAAADYEAAVKAQFIADYRAQGYQLTGDLTLFRRDFDPAYATYVAGTQTTTATTTLFSNPDNPSTTVATYSLNDWSYQESGGISEDTVTLGKEVIVSDDASISGFVSTTQDWDSDYIWASIDWNEIGKPFGFADRSSSAGFVYGSSGEVIGTVDYLYERFYSTGVAVSVLEQLHPGQSFPYPSYTTLYPDKQQFERTTTWTTEGYSEVLAGDSDNYIEYGGIVDAGGGDDVVFAAQVAYGNDGNDSIYGGQAAFGGSGADSLSGALLQSGGEGDDVLQGREEANRFIFSDGEPGRDFVIDSADFTDSVKAWYFDSQLGLADWEVRDEFGGMYLVTGEWFDTADFGVSQEVADWLLDPAAGCESHPDYEWMSDYEIKGWLGTKSLIQTDLSLMRHVEPLPPLPVSGANDYAALLPLYEQGVLGAPDTIELPESMTASSLIASTVVVDILLRNPESDRIEPYAALDIAMGVGQSAVVVIPHGEDGLGSGVEWFSFADGSTLNIQELLDALTVAPASLDPQDLDNAIEVTASDTYVYSDGSGYEIAGRAGKDEILGSVFGDILYGDEGDDILSGNAGNDDLYGGEGNNTLLGGEGDDFLDGGDGNDVLEGGAGRDYLLGGAGDDTYRFGPGTERDVVEEEGGGVDSVRVADGFEPGDVTVARNDVDLTLGLNGGADRMILANWFDSADRVEQIVFGDGTVLDEVAMTAASAHTMTAVDDQASLQEDGGTVSGNLLANDFSSEAGALLQVTNPGQYAGGYGVLSLNADGSYSYVLEGNAGQSLAEAEFAADVFLYSVEDDLLTAADASLRIDITGQNDSPVIGTADIAGTVTEDEGAVMTVPVGKSLLVNGGFETGDSTGWTISTTNPYYVGTGVANFDPRTGDYALIGGAQYYVDFAEQRVATAAGEPYVLELWLKGGLPPIYESFPGFEVAFAVDWGGEILLSLTDGYFEQYERLQFDITGSGAEDALVIAMRNDPEYWYLDDVSLRATDDALVIPDVQSTTGVIDFSDLDVSDAHVVSVASGAAGYVGTFDAQLLQDSTGTGSGSVVWNFSVGNADLAFLAEGQSLTQSYDVTIDDSQPGGATTQTVTVTINGSGEGLNATPVALDDTIAAQEDGGVVIVPLTALLANDSDTDIGDTLTVTAVSTTASGAPVGLEADTVTYDPGALFQALREGQIATDSFTYTIADTLGATATATVTVNVAGANDEPFVVTSLDDQTATEETAFAYTIPATSFDDVDDGDVLTLSAVHTGGALLPDWLQFEPLTGAFSGTPLANDAGLLSVTVTATDLTGSSVSQTFDLDVRFLDRGIVGTSADETLLGGGGNDTVDGGAGADQLGGGGGNDLLLGGAGDDTYTFNAGDGIDTIVDTSSPDETNTLVFGEGITPDMLSLSLGSMVITIGDNGDAVHLQSFDGSDPFNTIDVRRFRFSDGTKWNTRDLLALGIVINATDEDDVLTGTAVGDFINGYGGNDMINGGGGRDVMAGGTGDDTFVVDNRHDVVAEQADEGADHVNSFVSYTLADNVESLTIIGTEKNVKAIGNAADNALIGNSKDNTLIGLAGNDWLDGGAGRDKLVGGAGHDTYVVDKTKDVIIEKANEGIDTVRSSVKWTLRSNLENLILVGSDTIDGKGNALANLLVGNSANNRVSSKSGNDIVQGLAGDDKLTNKSGTALIDGGIGADALTGSTGNEMFIGGLGDDAVSTGPGGDIVAFNLGDGQDSVKSRRGADNILSLGGGISYADLSLTRHRKDLLLNIGANDSVSLLDWYSSDSRRSVLTLQIIAEAMAEFDAGGSNPLLDNKVEIFDFLSLANVFDAAGQVDNWSLTNALLDAHLAGSDTDALGGDLAYQYGVNGTLTGIGVTAAQEVLNAPQFGSGAQTLRPLEELQQGQTRLS